MALAVPTAPSADADLEYDVSILVNEDGVFFAASDNLMIAPAGPKHMQRSSLLASVSTSFGCTVVPCNMKDIGRWMSFVSAPEGASFEGNVWKLAQVSPGHTLCHAISTGSPFVGPQRIVCRQPTSFKTRTRSPLQWAVWPASWQGLLMATIHKPLSRSSLRSAPFRPPPSRTQRAAESDALCELCTLPPEASELPGSSLQRSAGRGAVARSATVLLDAPCPQHGTAIARPT